ncbi:hypothetical protein PFISCL1PPCAC_5048, partial [Pristionchus fissidentatus]
KLRVRKKQKAQSEAEAKRIENNLESLCSLLAGLNPALSPDVLSHTLDRCSLAVEELSGVQTLTLDDASHAVETVEHITAHLDKLNLLLRHTEEMAAYVKKKREEIDHLERTHFPEGLPEPEQ